MIRIKLMADYQCFPLWGADEENLGNISPHSLPISEKLKEDLIEWGNQYDLTLNLDDPANSGFKDENAELHFRKFGEQLLQRLQIELGRGYSIFLRL